MHLKTNIQSLSIISSCGCNLACHYCAIAKTKNEQSAKVQEATIQALQDGSFIKNARDVLLRLNQSPANITNIDLWGQEPTLTLHYIADHLTDWFTTFPSIKTWFFSTNGIAHTDRILDFIKKMDAAAPHPIGLRIQVSHDGEIGTFTVRDAEPTVIQRNLTFLIEQLNQIDLKNITVTFSFNGVASLELIHQLDSFEKVVQYYKTLDTWVMPLHNLNRNKNVQVNDFICVSPELPVDASAEEGLMMADFYRRTLRINPNIVDSRSIGSLAAQVSRGLDHVAHDMQVENLASFFDTLAQDANMYYYMLDRLSHSIFCGAFYGELKIMYDGTCISCQNSIFETELENLPQTKDIDVRVRRNFVKRKIILNPLKESDEVIERTFDTFYEGKNSSFYFMMSNHIAMMQLLVDAHQIDSSYQNPVKQLVHSIALVLISGCGYSNWTKTGSLFAKDAGFFRYYCNGLLDELITLNPGWKEIKHER